VKFCVKTFSLLSTNISKSDRYRDLKISHDDVTCSTAVHSEADDFVKRSVTILN